ncbi:serine/threonine-protein kinase [Stigmatella aurantiaca]|uniref:Serine/threonine-protein kinase pkn n=1 Tax=Stigmatella aurantiaca (strain DW4/3-1) TaxID=378806 RepID=Q093Q6_STIAD|nr:serine/threonine-protein kinase [Stigmatella aurantiaca]ADO71073.1 Serine/threonine-protein kinase pkn [Stigmatella aurantiaca DW4/3-1]EAU66951.1 serine/threonine-protein kinase Pkn5 [Stigmatella aurantiaca DW4/3-1]
MPPKLIGPYRVMDTLGSGGVGTVYRALDRRTNDTVALKLLSAAPALDARAARRLAREYETLAELAHPNVVKVFDVGVFQGYPYLVMELIEGLTLRHYLDLRGSDLHSPSGSFSLPRSRALPSDDDSDSWGDAEDSDDSESPFNLAAFSEEEPSEDMNLHGGAESVRALADAADEPDTEGSDDTRPSPALADPKVQLVERRIQEARTDELNRPERMGRLKDAMLQVCEALAYIHGHGLVHRDLKPSNIMVDEDRQVRLMDFGLAKFLADDAGLTGDGRFVGTFRYMSPEQILGEPLDARADLYSLGVILYELLSGRPPFDAKTPSQLWQQVLEVEPAPVLAINLKGDPQLARVAHRLLRKELDDRYQTAEEVYEALAE